MRTLILILSVLLISSTSYGRQIPPLEGLEALRSAFSGISDFSAEITQEKKLSVMKRTMQMNGVVRFRKPDLFYLEILSPYSSRILLRDSTIEQVMGGGGERNRIVLPPEQGLKSWFTRFSSPMKSLPEGMGIQADLTGTLYTVTISPQGKGQVKEMQISFQDDGTFRKLVIVERNGDRATMTFRKVRRNTGLADRDFSLE